MSPLVIFFIAFRYIFGKTADKFSQFMYWISSIFIILGMAIMIVILSLMNGFENELKKKLLYLIPHIMITSSTGNIHINNIPDFLFHIIPSDEILYIKPLIISNVILQSNTGISLGMMLGINPNHFEPLSNCLINNDIKQLISGKYYIIIGSDLARRLSVNINDQIRLIIPSISNITPFGYFPSQRLCVISDIYLSNDIDSNVNHILLHKDDASKLMHYPDQSITGWRIWIRHPLKINQFNCSNIPKDWVWTDWSKYKGSLFHAIKIEKNIMFLLFILIIAVSGCNIISFLVLLMTEKQKEIAILKTYGFNRNSIITVFIIQGLGNGIFSTIWGASLGILLSKKLNQILFFMNIFSKKLTFPIEIQYFQILIISLIVYILIMLIILFPAWKIASTRPAKILRHG